MLSNLTWWDEAVNARLVKVSAERLGVPPRTRSKSKHGSNLWRIPGERFSLTFRLGSGHWIFPQRWCQMLPGESPGMRRNFGNQVPFESVCCVVQESSEGDLCGGSEARWDGEGYTGSSAPLTAPPSSHPQVLHQLSGERHLLHRYWVLRGKADLFCCC